MSVSKRMTSEDAARILIGKAGTDPEAVARITEALKKNTK